MLHLLPVRCLLTVVVVLAASAVLAAVYAGAMGTGDALADIKWIIRSASTASFVLMFLSYAAWRWVPCLQRVIFPYLGGDWVGELQFDGSSGTGTREVTLTVNHSLLKISLILDSAESTSGTLVVQADRDARINRDRLYYIYLNERKEGVKGAGDNYRGLAVLRVVKSGHPALHGDYFTELQGRGKLKLNLRRCHPWWALWK